MSKNLYKLFCKLYKLDGKESKKLGLDSGFPTILTDIGVSEESLSSNLGYALFKALKEAPKAKRVSGLVKVVSRPSEVDLTNERRIFPRAYYSYKNLYLTVRTKFTVGYKTLYKHIASRLESAFNLDDYKIPDYFTAAKLFVAIVKYWEDTECFYDLDDYEGYRMPKILNDFDDESMYVDFVLNLVKMFGACTQGPADYLGRMLLSLFLLEAAGIDDYTLSRYKSATSRLWENSDVKHFLAWTRYGLQLKIDPFDPWRKRDEYFEREKPFYSRLADIISDQECLNYFTTAFPVDYYEEKLRETFTELIAKEHPPLKSHYGEKFKNKMKILYDYFATTQANPIKEYNPAIFNYSPIFNNEYPLKIFTPGCIPPGYNELVREILKTLISLHEENKLISKFPTVKWEQLKVPMCNKFEFIEKLFTAAKKLQQALAQ